MMKNLENDGFTELKNHTNFDSNAATLEKLMLNGESSDTWVTICEKSGWFLAIARKHFEANDSKSDASVKKQSALAKWIEKMNESWDSISSATPERLKQHLDMNRIKQRGIEVAELLKKGNVRNFDNFLTKNVQMLRNQQDVQINSNDVELVSGPLGLDVAIFIADILIKYHQQLTLRHVIRYATSDCAKAFGRAYDESKNGTEDEVKIFWKQTSLLAGWEVIRRVIADESLYALSFQQQIDLSDVFEAGLRLIYNERIDSIGFMIVVALAEL